MWDLAFVLIRQTLTYGSIHSHAPALKLQHGKSDPVDGQDDIRASRRLSTDSANTHFLRYCEVVVLRMLPVDEGIVV